MTKKSYIMSTLITGFTALLLFTISFIDQNYAEPKSVYQIYLDGEKIGIIADREEFYDLINKEQVDIKEEYNVDQVYPPKGFEIVPLRTYNEEQTTASAIYDTIKNERDFTIKGYTITIKPTVDEKSNEETQPITINVLDRQVFEDAITKYVTTFVEAEKYQDYINGTQEQITDVGQTINSMYFEDKITIKESYINVSETVYTDSDKLVKKLLFGDNVENKDYTVKEGDTLETIAENNKLNIQELLIANENIKDEDSLLAIGQVINIALIKPVLTLVYDIEVSEIIEQPFKTEKKYDNSRYSNYRHTEIKGINGLAKITYPVRVINGEMSQNAQIENSKTEIIRAPQNEVVVYGTRYNGGGTVIPSGESWGLPTNFPYIVTSEYGYRWGTLHDGIDISGTGYNSPIYAVLGGEVINAGWGGFVGENTAGYNVVIKHPNGYYTVYAHMSSMPLVKVGDIVEQGQHIGKMGDSGWADGVHVHLGVFKGMPYYGGTPVNPRSVILF